MPLPPPAYNFAEIPRVYARDDLWHEKHPPTNSARRPDPAVEQVCHEREDAEEAALEAAIEHGESSLAQNPVTAAVALAQVHHTHDADPRDTHPHGSDHDNAHAHGIHMPDQSWWPFFTAIAIFVGGVCFVNDWFPGAIAGAALLVFTVADEPPF